MFPSHDRGATYADAAGSTPVDGTGGSATTTFTRQSGTVLRGNQSFKITKDAANRQGEGASYDFTIKEQDVSKKLKIQFDFKTNEDAAYATGDYTVYIYDVTNSTLITPVDTDIIAGQNIFQTSFNSTTSTSYRLIFHCATTNASAYDIYIDNVIVGPGMTSQGAAIGPWQDFTPTWRGSNASTRTNELFKWRRVGETAELLIGFTVDTPTGTDEVGIDLPSEIGTVASEYQGIARIGLIGVGYLWDGSGRDSCTAYFNSATQFQFLDGTFANISWNELANGDYLGITIRVPIQEWQGKGIVPMLAEDNLSEWIEFTPSLNNFTNDSALTEGRYRRVGDSIEVAFTATHATGGGSGGDITFDINSNFGLNTKTSFLSIAKNATVGSGWARDLNAATAATTIIPTIYGPLPNLVYFTETDSSATNNIDGTNFSAGDYFSVVFTVPVQEWGGSQNSLVGYSQADGTNTGLLPPVTSMSSALATQLGYKQYTSETITGTNSWSQDRAVLIPYQTFDGLGIVTGKQGVIIQY